MGVWSHLGLCMNFNYFLSGGNEKIIIILSLKLWDVLHFILLNLRFFILVHQILFCQCWWLIRSLRENGKCLISRFFFSPKKMARVMEQEKIDFLLIIFEQWMEGGFWYIYIYIYYCHILLLFLYFCSLGHSN